MIRKIFSSQLRINITSGLVTTVINTVVLGVAYPVYLHFLGYESYGVWLVLATVLTFVQLCDLGISHAIVRLVAEEYGRGDIEGIQRYVATALVLLCLSGTIALVVILILKNAIITAFKLSDENARIGLWLLPYIGILSIYAFMVQALNAALSGLGRMDLANYIQSLGRVVAVFVAGILLYSGRGIGSLLIASTISYILIHVASIVYIRRIANIRFLQIANLDVQRGKHILRFGGAVFSGSLINMFISPFNKLMLSRYVGVSSIPVYELAFNGSMQVRAMAEAGLRSLMPEISRISANITTQAKNRISQLNSHAMKLIFFFGIPVYVVVVVFAPVLLRLWLGERFVETLPMAFRIMLIGTFLSLLGVPAYYTLMGMGYIRHNLASHIVQSVVNVAMILTSILFNAGVSLGTIVISTSAGMGVSAAYLIWQKRKTFNCLICETLTTNTSKS